MTASPRKLWLWTAVALVAAGVGIVLARSVWLFSTRPDLELATITQVGFVVQVVALIAGVLLVNVVEAGAVESVLVVEGVICLLAYGLAGVAFLVGLLACWAVLELHWLGRARFVLGLALIAGLDACAWSSDQVASAALLFSVLFTMRLLVYGYERWQNADERTPLRGFLVYMLVAPLLVVPPAFSIVPMFGLSTSRVRPALTTARLRTVARHLAFAALFGALRVGLARLDLRGEHLDFASMHWRLISNVLGLATIGHVVIALLLMHGIEERMPTNRPFLATRFIELWNRLSVHLKDAQVFLFYTPALLRFRRLNRYLVLVVATFWTIVVGNTLLHIAVRYCFLSDPMQAIGWGVVANVVMATVLAFDLCSDEWWRRRGGRPERTAMQRALGWLVTMTTAAFVQTL